MKKNKGFTLLELLVVMVVLISTGIVIGGILFSSLRGVTKTNTLTAVRENGDFAISQIVKMIRNAKEFKGVSTDGETFFNDCSVGGVPKYYHIKITSPDGGETTFSCEFATISSKSASFSNISLIDTRAVVVKQDSCFFTCSQESLTETPTIGIRFSLQQEESINVFQGERTAAIDFQTSVTMRNALR